MSAKIKRRAISLEDKYKIIKMIENKKSYEEIAIKMGNNFKTNTISKIKSQRENNLRIQRYDLNQGQSVRDSKYPKVDKQLIVP